MGLDFCSKNKPRDNGLFQIGQTNRAPQLRPNTNSGIVPMEVHAAIGNSHVLFKKLMDEEHDLYCKQGWCFRCRQTGHMACECPGRPPQNSNSSTTGSAHITTTATSTVSDTTMAVNPTAEITPNDSVSNAPVVCTTTAKPKLMCAQQIAKLKEEMSDDERSSYLDSRDMESDFYSAEL